MFEIAPETKAAAIEAMRAALGDNHSDEELGAAFDVAVDIVKRQFGM